MGGFLPIDFDFQENRKIVDEHNGHKVWGPVEPQSYVIDSALVAFGLLDPLA